MPTKSSKVLFIFQLYYFYLLIFFAKHGKIARFVIYFLSNFHHKYAISQKRANHFDNIRFRNHFHLKVSVKMAQLLYKLQS